MKKKIFFLVLLLALTVHLHLEEINPESLQAKKEQQALRHEVTVVLKLVQVYVTDNKGNPVTDLSKEDFILYDNGKMQTITDFERHLLSRAERLPGPEKEVEERISETALSPSPETASRMNRKFILLLDIDRNDAPGVGKSKKAALHFLDTQVLPTDEVGVFSYSRYYGLIIHEYLTSDHDRAREAIEAIAEIPGIRPRSSTELTLEGEQERAEAEMAGAGREGGKEGMATSQTLESSGSPLNFSFVENPGDPDDIEHRTEKYIFTMRELSKAMRYIPGYKNIILFSAGIPRYLLYSADQKFRERYEEMAKEMASSSSPVYTVNTMGIKRDQTLETLSRLSGGRFFHNVEDYQKIADQIQNATSSYYVLGYSIDESWDGRYHEIKVRVNRKGCQVNAQQGYFNPKPFPELSEFEKMLHLVDVALGENPYFQTPLTFNAMALLCSRTKGSNLVLLSEIPIDTISDVAEGKAELVTFIFNTKNKIVSSAKGEIDFSSFSQKTIYHYTLSSLSPGRYECRLVLRNLKTGKAAVASSSVTITEPSKSGIMLYPPLLLIPDNKSVYLKLAGGKETEAISLTDVYPFVTSNHSPVFDVLSQETAHLFGVLVCAVGDVPDPAVKLSAHLVEHQTGLKMPLQFSVPASLKEKDTEIFLLEFKLPELKPGEYSIEISAEEVSTQSKSKVIKKFKVR
ncbi:MAG: VWA domain-containing protein [Candidatus Aminicenantes bacterium]|nr:VWA domain-containing protein [Candidatus Aminicenantes bacterium]MDH5705084.1 VWA domain-containing protein [Candidatus Aminicenantes bacterium]